MCEEKSVIIEICYGPECSDCGGRELAEALAEIQVAAVAGDCRSQCPNAPLVLINNKMVIKATVEKVLAKLEEEVGIPFEK